MTQYLISVWHDDDYEVDFSSPVLQRMVGQVSAFNDDVMAAGAWVFGGGLMPAKTATAFRFGDADATMTDGPYAESKEQIGGFWVIEAADLDTALDWGKRAAIACEGNVEVRPFQSE
jgi:hypothetical protein